MEHIRKGIWMAGLGKILGKFVIKVLLNVMENYLPDKYWLPVSIQACKL